jgi:hypothetical protein
VGWLVGRLVGCVLGRLTTGHPTGGSVTNACMLELWSSCEFVCACMLIPLTACVGLGHFSLGSFDTPAAHMCLCVRDLPVWPAHCSVHMCCEPHPPASNPPSHAHAVARRDSWTHVCMFYAFYSQRMCCATRNGVKRDCSGCTAQHALACSFVDCFGLGEQSMCMWTCVDWLLCLCC